MELDLINQIIIGLPNFVGLVVCVVVLARQNNRLIDALIKRENCEDRED